MSITLAQWLPEISRMVPGAKSEVIYDALHVIVREFCAKSLLYIRTLPAVNVVAGVGTYNLTAPTDTVIVMVERLTINSIPLDPTSQDLLDRSPDAWEPITAKQPNTYMMDAEKVLKLKEIPLENITAGLIVSVSLKPTWTTLVVPDFIYEDWYEAIKHGTLEHLMQMPNQTFTNVKMAEFHGREYKGVLSDAKGRKYTGKAKVSIRAAAKPFSIVG